MQFGKIHNKGQARLFKSGFLEVLTKAHPLLIWCMYLPVLPICFITAISGLNMLR